MIMMNVASQKIFKLFQDNAHKPFVIVEHNGNFGDHLISKGGYKLADLAGLDYKVVSHDEFMASTYDENTVIYFQGGGGFNPYCDGQVWEQLQKVCATHKGLTIGGPQTYINDSKFLKNTVFKGLEEKGKGRVILFVREKVSHKILKENMPLWMELDIDHDTAFNLSRVDFDIEPSKGHYLFYAIRDDKELRPVYRDGLFKVWFDPAIVCQSFDHWVNVHNEARELITNRLHSSIMGAILGKPVKLFSNVYFKNRAIWEYSLSSKGVQWIDHFGKEDAWTKALNTNYVTKRILNSSRVNACVRKILSVPCA